MKGQLRIDQMYAFIVLDDDGTEGVPAVMMPGHFPMLVPLMGADMARVDSIRDIIQHDPTLKGKKITLAKFTVRENLEVIDRTREENEEAHPRRRTTH